MKHRFTFGFGSGRRDNEAQDAVGIVEVETRKRELPRLDRDIITICERDGRRLSVAGEAGAVQDGHAATGGGRNSKVRTLGF